MLHRDREDILFIVNPSSGTGNKRVIPSGIYSYLNGKKFQPHIEFTAYPGHATEITCKALEMGIKKIVAVGGDGTVNEIARVLLNKDISLGILPQGSGNGLARHLNIPIDLKKSIELLNNCREIKIDSGVVNERPFFCTSGVGFDAHIGSIFASKIRRGLRTYISSSVQEFFSYKPSEYSLFVNGEKIKTKAFLITFANSSQYGNNACISPYADIQDGLLDVCVLEPFPKRKALSIGLRLFNKNMHACSYLKIIQSREVVLHREEAGFIHLDGEPYKMGPELSFSSVPSSLKVLVPPIS
ncbi:MAG: diacylglycerol/lipid kinase family protein [Cytophagaceae bacterium]